MTELAPVQIIALVSPVEQPGIKTGAEFLHGCLRAVRKGSEQPIRLAFADPQTDPKSLPPAAIYILSMLPELARPRRLPDEVIAHRKQQISVLQERTPLVFLCNVFRHIGNRTTTGAPDEAIARIRELNLAAIRLSHQTGVNVIDIDRTFAYYGEPVFRADFRLGSHRAADGVGHAVASAVLESGPDQFIDPLDQQNARTALGDLAALPGLIRRREEARMRKAQADG